MKKIISVVLTAVILFTSFIVASANDPRLVFRGNDDTVPTKDGQFFTRYTPWLKAYHPMTTEEINSGAHGGEACQQIRALDISPADPNLIIFGTDTSGMWMSTDGGDFWYNTHRGISSSDISDVFCHPSNTDIMFCYTIGTGTTEETQPGIYRSIDKGRNWTRVYTDYISSSKTDKLFAYDTNGNIYSISGHGVIKSTDDGSTWNVLLNATEENSATNRAPAASIKISADGQAIVACYSSDTFSLGGANISTDGGKTWSKLSFNGETAVSAYAFEFDENNGNRYIAAINSPSLSRYGLFISNDKGTTWKEFRSTESAEDTYMVRSHDSIRRMRLTDEFLYVTYNAADKTFRYINYDSLDEDVSALLFPYLNPWKTLDFAEEIDCSSKFRDAKNMFYSQGFDIQGDTMFVCSAGPHKYTFSTDKWERKSEGFSGISVVDFEMDESGNMLLSRTDGNVIRSSRPYTENSPATFYRPTGNYSTTVATMAVVDPFDAEGDRIIGWSGSNNSTGLHCIIISDDNGVTWNEVSASKDKVDADGVLLEYSKNPDTPKTIYTSSATSADNGNVWNLNQYYYLDVDYSKGKERILAWDLYGVDNSSPTYKFMYSADGGTTWKSLANVGASKISEVMGFFDTANVNKVWYKSQRDFGTIDLTTGVKISYKNKTAYQSYNNLVQNPNKPNHFILTCEYDNNLSYCPTLMQSLDYGESWHIVPGFMGRRSVANESVTFSTTTNEVFIGSANGIIVYEYDNFDYYQAVKFTNGNEEKLTTYEMYDGKISLPDIHDVFPSFSGQIFKGWEYNGKSYPAGSLVEIE